MKTKQMPASKLLNPQTRKTAKTYFEKMRPQMGWQKYCKHLLSHPHDYELLESED